MYDDDPDTELFGNALSDVEWKIAGFCSRRLRLRRTNITKSTTKTHNKTMRMPTAMPINGTIDNPNKIESSLESTTSGAGAFKITSLSAGIAAVVESVKLDDESNFVVDDDDDEISEENVSEY